MNLQGLTSQHDQEKYDYSMNNESSYTKNNGQSTNYYEGSNTYKSNGYNIETIDQLNKDSVNIFNKYASNNVDYSNVNREKDDNLLSNNVILAKNSLYSPLLLPTTTPGTFTLDSYQPSLHSIHQSSSYNSSHNIYGGNEYSYS